MVSLVALCNRGRVTDEMIGGVPIFSLLDVEMEMFPEEECPVCKEKGPDSVRIDLGKGAEWLRIRAVKNKAR